MNYLVPGLEMDPRIMTKLLFRGEKELEIIKYVEPLENESLADYAKRLSPQIQHKDATFIGFSFGGLLALELARINSYRKVVLISAPKHSQEVPLWHRILGHSRLMDLLPDSFYTDSVVIRNYLMGMKTKERGNLKKIHSELPKGLVRWGIRRALHWDFRHELPNVFQIHSSDDRIYKSSLVTRSENVTMINRGGHLVFAYRPKLVSEALKPHLFNSTIQGSTQTASLI